MQIRTYSSSVYRLIFILQFHKMMKHCTTVKELTYVKTMTISRCKEIHIRAQYQCTNHYCRRTFRISNRCPITEYAIHTTGEISKMRALCHICTVYKLSRNGHSYRCVICRKHFADCLTLTLKKLPLRRSCYRRRLRAYQLKIAAKANGTNSHLHDSDPYTNHANSRPVPKCVAQRRVKLLAGGTTESN